MDLQELKKQTETILADILEKSALSSGDIFVLGLSSSEVTGGHIGKNSSQEVGEAIRCQFAEFTWQFRAVNM